LADDQEIVLRVKGAQKWACHRVGGAKNTSLTGP